MKNINKDLNNVIHKFILIDAYRTLYGYLEEKNLFFKVHIEI